MGLWIFEIMGQQASSNDSPEKDVIAKNVDCGVISVLWMEDRVHKFTC